MQINLNVTLSHTEDYLAMFINTFCRLIWDLAAGFHANMSIPLFFTYIMPLHSKIGKITISG
jgi:hypothetical protein